MPSDVRPAGTEPPGGPDEGVSSVDATTDEIFELQEEIGQLKQAITSHAVVDQAIGMMVALGRVTPDQGWVVLQEVSQHTNVKLRDIAEMIIAWGGEGDMWPDVRAALEETLDKYGPTQIPDDPPDS
ncbi:ANTAR domain-containing protein [Streptomyces sp. SAS_270]|uniref:ANTAR domain-containing protein n=1 Tax=Streptomyces sp. SAS_270 TaxID=3412748 RepID=UPI00403C8932